MYPIYVIALHNIFHYGSSVILCAFDRGVHPVLPVFELYHQIGPFFNNRLVADGFARHVMRPVWVKPHVQLQATLMGSINPKLQRIVIWLRGLPLNTRKEGRPGL
ncbi:hypothetical protein D3C87_1454830 [compost metagenome]